MAKDGQGGFPELEAEGLGSNVCDDLQIKPRDRGPMRDKEVQGTVERVVNTELRKASGAD